MSRLLAYKSKCIGGRPRDEYDEQRDIQRTADSAIYFLFGMIDGYLFKHVTTSQICLLSLAQGNLYSHRYSISIQLCPLIWRHSSSHLVGLSQIYKSYVLDLLLWSVKRTISPMPNQSWRQKVSSLRMKFLLAEAPMASA